MTDGTPRCADLLRNREGRIRPTQALARAGDFGGTERRAVRRCGAGLGRGTEGNGRAAGDQRGPVAAPGPRQRRRHRVGIMAVDALGRPTARLEAGDLVVRDRQVGGAVDRDRIVVPQNGELCQAQMAGEGDRLVADAFHQAAVAGDHIGAMVDQRGAEPCRQQAFGERHADGIAETLAKRPGRRFDAFRMAIFGMTGGAAAELAEALQLVERHIGIAGEMKQPVEQHRAVAGRQHEAIAVRPVGIGGVEFEEVAEENGRHIRHPHRHAGMTGFGLLDSVHREGTQCVRHVAQVAVPRLRKGLRGGAAGGFCRCGSGH